MSQTGYTGGRRNPKVMVAIVGGHAAVLAAVMLIKMDLPIPFVPPAQIVRNIPLPPPPKDLPPPDPSPRPKPLVDQRVDLPIPPVPLPLPGPDLAPPTDPKIFTLDPPGSKTVIAPPAPPMPTPPAPPPEPPALRAKPVALAPRGNPAGWVTNDDYPSAALRSEEQGRTRFVVVADASGRPTECTVTGSSGSSALDKAACRLLMKRARFKPGTDADGAAVGGSWASSFLWKIPED